MLQPAMGVNTWLYQAAEPGVPMFNDFGVLTCWSQVAGLVLGATSLSRLMGVDAFASALLPGGVNGFLASEKGRENSVSC